MTIEYYFKQIGKMLEIVFPEHKINLIISSDDGYYFSIYKGSTDEERLINPTYKFILKDISNEVKDNINKRNTVERKGSA